MSSSEKTDFCLSENTCLASEVIYLGNIQQTMFFYCVLQT